MDTLTFSARLHDDVREALKRLDALQDPEGQVRTQAEVVRRLKVALRQELEAAELAASWIPSTPEVDVKLAQARLCGDEARHYRLIAARLKALGEDVSRYDPFEQGRTGLYQFLVGLTDTAERVAAANFTREAIGHLRNEQFIAFCESVGDHDTARMYREEIQPDEWFHFENGRELLEKYAIGEERQAKVRAVSEKTLQMAENLMAKLVEQKMSCSPGC